GPIEPTTSTSASFAFTSTPSGATFQCKLDSDSYGACTSPTSYTGLSRTPHTFSVRATAAGLTDQSPATPTCTISPLPDTTPRSDGRRRRDHEGGSPPSAAHYGLHPRPGLPLKREETRKCRVSRCLTDQSQEMLDAGALGFVGVWGSSSWSIWVAPLPGPGLT